ncbi:MAG: DUF4124 domain-containing protein [Gallionella sp.]
MNKFSLIVVFVSGIACSFPVAAKMYKWVDGQGVTHYSTIIPPKYANKDREVLNKSGIIINRHNILTSKERRAKAAEAAKVDAKNAVIRDKKRYDKSLVSTYSNVNEIELSRSRSLQQVDARINSLSSQLKTANLSWLGLQKRVLARQKAGKKIPKFLQDEAGDAAARVQQMQQDLSKYKQEKVTVGVRYDAEKARYKALTGK